jgi:hypothetical protein
MMTQIDQSGSLQSYNIVDISANKKSTKASIFAIPEPARSPGLGNTRGSLGGFRRGFAWLENFLGFG